MTETPPPPAGDATPGRRRGRLAALAAVGAVVVAAVLYNFYWEYSAGQFKTGIEQWLKARARDGIRITHGEIRVDGYPFRLRAVVPQPSAARFAGAFPWSWRGPAVTLTARPWRPSRMTLTAPGRHWLTAALAGRVREYDVAVAVLAVKLRIRGADIARAGLTLRDAVAREDGAEALRVAAAGGAVSRPAKPDAGQPSLIVSAEADGLAYGAEPVPGLGRVSERLAVFATVARALPPTMGRADLAAWRDRGGVVDVRRLAVRHGALAFDGDGTVTLDADMQPLAAFTVRVRGHDRAIDALVAAGAVKPRPAALAKAALALLAAGQGGGELKAALSIQDRRLYLGPVAVARLPAIAWD